MSYTRYKMASFGLGKASLATVGYRLYDTSGAAVGGRVTAGVTERPVGSGTYGAEITIPSAFEGELRWDTGGGSPVYASEQINPGEYEYLDQAASSAVTLVASQHVIADSIPAATLAANQHVIADSLTTNNDKSGYALAAAQHVIADAIPAVTGATLAANQHVLADSLAGYVAPDNAGVAAVKARTDNLPGDPASATQVATRLAASAYTSPDNAGITTIEDLAGALVDAVAAVPGAVWDEIIALHMIAGSAGQHLDSAAAAADPMGVLVPGSYVEGTAGWAIADVLRLIGALGRGTAVSLVSPMAARLSGAVRVVRGDDYTTGSLNGPLVWQDTSGRYTSLVGLTGTFAVTFPETEWTAAMTLSWPAACSLDTDGTTVLFSAQVAAADLESVPEEPTRAWPRQAPCMLRFAPAEGVVTPLLATFTLLPDVVNVPA